MSASALAADDSFVGKWKFNPDKSQMNGLDYKIEDAGGGQYRFVFGDDVETLALDGKGHVTKYGDTWSIKTTGPNSWESINERDGKMTNKSKWTVSERGHIQAHRWHLRSRRHLADHVSKGPLAHQHYDSEMEGRRVHPHQPGLQGNPGVQTRRQGIHAQGAAGP